MVESIINKPDETEYPPAARKYLSMVPGGGDLLTMPSRQLNDTLALVRKIPEDYGCFRYAPDKWSVKEVIGHLIDTERSFGFRAQHFARNSHTPLLGVDSQAYITPQFDNFSFDDLASEFECVRRGNLYLFKHLDQEAWMRRGMANGMEFTVCALAYILAGHEPHHKRILQAKYNLLNKRLG